MTSSKIRNRDYKKLLSETIFERNKIVEEIDVLEVRRRVPDVDNVTKLSMLYNNNKTKTCEERVLPNTADALVDAAGLSDDFYHNVLDWSDDNIVAVALGSNVYLWDIATNNKNEIVRLENENVTSLKFAKCESSFYLAVGCQNGNTLIMDTLSGDCLRTFNASDDPVYCLDWNGPILSQSSGETGIIQHFDVRQRNYLISEWRGHLGKVTSLKWQKTGEYLASGGNDNQINIWDRNGTSLYSLREHRAAVRALEWCPWQRNLLVSGGGAGDKTIKFWNTVTGKCLRTHTTNSQICSVHCAKNKKEILTSHGYSDTLQGHSDNVLSLWKYPQMEKIGDLTGFSGRPLHTSISPDGTSVVAGYDETVSIWKLWEETPIYESESSSRLSVRKLR
jgi:cell division cycle protein 20 (cofactor of APC complex)